MSYFTNLFTSLMVFYTFQHLLLKNTLFIIQNFLYFIFFNLFYFKLFYIVNIPFIYLFLCFLHCKFNHPCKFTHFLVFIFIFYFYLINSLIFLSASFFFIFSTIPTLAKCINSFFLNFFQFLSFIKGFKIINFLDKHYSCIFFFH